jgi:hypothetical protein
MRTRLARAAATLLFSLLLARCAAPLGPGYWIRSQTVRARYRPASSELAVNVAWRLRNTGTGPLELLELRLPASLAAQAPGLEVKVDGAETALSPAVGGEPGSFVLPFHPPWPRRQDRDIELRYRLALGPRAAPGPAAFHLGFLDWFPRLAPPSGRFSHGWARAKRIQMAILVPPGFRVLTSGTLQGIRESAGGLEYRYAVLLRDGWPFLLVGRYAEQKLVAPGSDVVLWTFAPLPAAEARAIATRLARVAGVYRKTFGRLVPGAGPLWIAETVDTGRLARAFPEGVLLDERWLAQARTSPDFLSVERAMAGVWFGHAVRPEPGAEIVLGAGVREYAALVAEESVGDPSVRPAAVAAWLDRYDRARARLKKEVPLAQMEFPAASADERELATSKAALFFIALEDRCGPSNVRRALAHLVRSLRGSTAGLPELRSALEESSGQNLAGFFHEWLDHVGIPATFLARYRPAGRALR